MNWKPFKWLLDNFVAWLDSHKMDKSKHHLKWDCIFSLWVFCLFVFIPWDNERDSYLKVESAAKRRHINTVCWKPFLLLPWNLRSWDAGAAESFLGSGVPFAVVRCTSPGRQGSCHATTWKAQGHCCNTVSLFFCCWSGNLHLPFCCCCHPSLHVTTFHLQMMCVVLSTFHSRIIYQLDSVGQELALPWLVHAAISTVRPQISVTTAILVKTRQFAVDVQN